MQVKFNFQIVTVFVILVFSSNYLLSKSCTKNSDCGAYVCNWFKCLTSCNVITDCNKDNLCLSGKCKAGCITTGVKGIGTSNNCKSGKECRGFSAGFGFCKTIYGKCYDKNNAGKPGNKCTYDLDCTGAKKGEIARCTQSVIRDGGKGRYSVREQYCPIDNAVCVILKKCNPKAQTQDLVYCERGYKCENGDCVKE